MVAARQLFSSPEIAPPMIPKISACMKRPCISIRHLGATRVHDRYACLNKHRMTYIPIYIIRPIMRGRGAAMRFPLTAAQVAGTFLHIKGLPTP